MPRSDRNETKSNKKSRRKSSEKPRTKRFDRIAAKKATTEKKFRVRKDGLLSDAGKVASGFDYFTLIIVLLLAIFGILMVFSASYYVTVNTADDALYYLKRQGFWVCVGLVVLVATSILDYHKYYKIANALMAASLVLLVLVLLIGIEVNGARRWLGYGFARITPSELSKIFMIVWTSAYLARRPENIKGTGLAVIFAVMGMHFLLVVKQPNLSTAIVIVMIMVAIMIVAGLNLWWIVAGIGGAGAGTFIILTFMKDSHWYSRLTNWIDPFADSQGEGYQVSQSIIALGNGGLKGLGFGNSIAKNLYLPEPQNDFILAIIGEELGYIGFLLLMAAYVLLLYRLIMIALRAKDKLGFYLATGVAVMLGLQVIINVAVVTASMPATGITLPFVSYGGTSMIVFMAAIGIALNVSSQGRKKAKR